MEVAGSALIFSREPLDGALAAVRGLGFRTVELAALEGWAHIAPSRVADDPAAETRRVAAALTAADLRPVAVNAGLGTEDPDEGRRRARALFEMAAALGVPVVTLPAPGGAAGLGAAAAQLRPLVEDAAYHGLTLAVETHMGAVTERPDAAALLCGEVPGLRLTLDPSHYWAGPAQGRGWRACIPFVAHVHLRDAGLGGWPQIQVWPGRGAVDFGAVHAALREVRYEGARSVEYIDTLPVAAAEVGAGAAEAAAEMARQAGGWGA